ncbi:MAG: DUF1513 domain-containing protein [Myxococcota bacterium]
MALTDAAPSAKLWTSVQGHIFGGGSFFQRGEQRFVLADMDLDAEAPRVALTDLWFLAHGFNVDPNDPTRAVVFEKKGPGAAYVDLRARTVLQKIDGPKRRHFYGHGAYSADGTLLYATESFLDQDHRGALIVRDAATFEELGEVPTFGASPHDCMLIDDGKVMVVANGGGRMQGGARPCVTYVDVASARLLEKVELKTARYNTGHLAMGTDGALAVVSAPRDGLPTRTPRLGAVSLRTPGKPLVTMSKPKRVVDKMKGETLSVAVHGDRVVATQPDGNMVTVWSLAQTKLVKKIASLQGPRGVCLTLEEDAFVVSHNVDGQMALTLLSTEDLSPVRHVPGSFTSGSHIYAHPLAA